MPKPPPAPEPPPELPPGVGTTGQICANEVTVPPGFENTHLIEHRNWNSTGNIQVRIGNIVKNIITAFYANATDPD